MRIRIYRSTGYRWLDKDPSIDHVRTMRDETGLNKSQISQLTGVSVSCLTGWFDGKTRKPNNTTLTAVSAGMGYVRADRLKADGTVEIRYIRAREYDWRRELERAADFWLKQNTPGPRRKRKRNKGDS